MREITDSVLCPFDLTVEPIARFLNAELPEHPVYDGIELQWFDDATHGTGLLAFLQRRADRRVDYYADPSLTLDPTLYAIGGGTGGWYPTIFERDRLEVARDGLVADVAFRDVDGRDVAVAVDDRTGAAHRRGTLLAPVGAGIDSPASLLLVVLHDFDLVRTVPGQIAIRIDGAPASTGALPGRRLHRRELVKYAAPLTTVTFARNQDGPIRRLTPAGPHELRIDPVTGSIVALQVVGGGSQHAEVRFSPGVPRLERLAEGGLSSGDWSISIDGLPITGGRWTAERQGDRVDLGMEVTRRWQPGPLPPVERIVTRVVPTFRRWPTTYRWLATVWLGETPTMTSRWQRIGADRGGAYRRATTPSASS